MPAAKIQADYPQLEKAAETFGKEADQTKQLIQRVRQSVDALQGGGWIGVGADKFYNEMDEIVFPAIDRMMNALNDANSATKRIADAFRKAEDEACGLFA